MKKLWLLLAVFALQVAGSERKIELKGTPVKAESLAIVVPQPTPLLDFAAGELQRSLNRVTGKKIPVVDSPKEGAISLILGDNELAKKAGLDVAKLPPEGFYIRRDGNRIFLLGRDSATGRPGANLWKQRYHRGTLNAVYDFLTRFADVRFFFPGKMGTVIPEGKGVKLPEKIDILDRPDYILRENYSGKSKWYEKEEYPDGVSGQNYSHLILRMSDTNIPFCHGLAHLNYIGRFGKTHPEYFAMMPDGGRYNRPELTLTGQLCFSSGIREEIYRDAKAYLTGKPASSRGLKSWNPHVGSGKYFCVMPQDWLYWCGCAKCSKIAPGGRDYKNHGRKMNEFLWRFTAEVASRLKKEGVRGTLTQMAYSGSKDVPECELPDNISVQIAVNGLGARRSWEADRELIKSWEAKLKHPVFVWAYPGKHMAKAELKGIPAMMHHQMGTYFQYMRPFIAGAFIESETDFEIFNYLNYYVFSQTAWNLDTDVAVLLRDHYQKMYGPCAAEMEKFFDDLEKLWCERVIGNIVDTGLGPVPKLPTDFEVWTNIYSPAKLAEWNLLFDRAEKKAAKAPEALARLRFIRKELFGPILAAAGNFKERNALIGSLGFTVPGTIWLRPFKGEVNEVGTRVDISRIPGAFVFEFDCEEPRMADVKAVQKKNDAPELYADSCVEVLLNPSGDRKNYRHFIVNVNGALYDADFAANAKGRVDWNSGAKASVERRADGYKIRLEVPEKALGKFNPRGFPVNFARHRALAGKRPGEIYYQWSPVAGGKGGFHSLERFGVMNLEPKKSENLLKDGNFNVKKRSAHRAGAWNLWRSGGVKGEQKIEFDPSVFLFGGRSLHLVNVQGRRLNASQYFYGLEPNRKYRFSYSMRIKDVRDGIGAGAYLYIGKRGISCPITRMTGTLPWHRLSFDFTTGKDVTPETKCSAGFWIWNAAGEAWFDCAGIVAVEE